jgi:hypothetical protein
MAKPHSLKSGVTVMGTFPRRMRDAPPSGGSGNRCHTSSWAIAQAILRNTLDASGREIRLVAIRYHIAEKEKATSVEDDTSLGVYPIDDPDDGRVVTLKEFCFHPIRLPDFRSQRKSNFDFRAPNP